jgi:hypothetical protein
MASFKATVQAVTFVNGDKNLSLGQIRDRVPSSLVVTSASVEGTNQVQTPEGTYNSPDVVASFPLSHVSSFVVSSNVTISWTSVTGSVLNGLAIA